MCRSEIAQLRQQIELEIETMRYAMSGVALGTARHAFIQARLERIGTCQNTLAHHVGERTANQIVCKLYMQVMESQPTQMEA